MPTKQERLNRKEAFRKVGAQISAQAQKNYFDPAYSIMPRKLQHPSLSTKTGPVTKTVQWEGTVRTRK